MAKSGPVLRSWISGLPGRLLIVGLAIKLGVFVLGTMGLGDAGLVQAISSVGSIALAIGLGYFVYRLILAAKQRLLWRVRRKLILSYIFIGVVPALLIVTFFVLCGLLLFFNVSSYLVKTNLRTLTDEAAFLARATAGELQPSSDARTIAAILQRRHASIVTRFPSASLALVPAGEHSCAAFPTLSRSPAPAPVRVGSWTHGDPPAALPRWMSCTGFGGIVAYSSGGPVAAASRVDGDATLVIRGMALQTASAPAYGIVLDIPIDDTVIGQLRDETSIEIRDIGLGGTDQPCEGTPAPTGSAPAASSEVGVPAARTVRGGVEVGEAPRTDSTYRFPWVALLEYVDWGTGEPYPLRMSISVDISAIYDRLASSQALSGARSFGDLLFIVVLLVAALFLVIEIAALIMGLALARSITGSVHELFTGTERVRQGDFTHRIAVRAHDQLGELASSFNSMTGSIEDLLVQSAEKKRLEEEMRLAREIQMSLLPQGPLSIEGMTVLAMCIPAREVGGDYYDLFRLDERRVGILIADVSGKGVSAALYMAELKGLMLSLSQKHHSPRDLLIDANRVISKHLDSRSFITMTYAIVDLDSCTMTYARAGHTPLIRLARDSRRAEILAPDGLVLGLRIDDGTKFAHLLQEATLPLRLGDVLMLFTDGISEAMNEGSDCFGEPRLGRLIEEHGDRPFEELREQILREIDSFVGAAPQHDDMTMILMKIGEAEALARPAATMAVRT